MIIDLAHGEIAYWILFALSIALSAVFCIFTVKRFGFSYVDLIKLVVVAAIFGFVGARVFSFLFRLKEVFEDSAMLVPLLTSGYMYYGGVMGGGLGGYLYCKKANKDPYAFLDMAALILPLAHAVGRVGCLLNGCCYGGVTEGGFYVCYPHGVWDGFEMVLQGQHLLPVQLFESIFNCLLFAVLLVIFLKKKRRGLIAGIYCIAYGIWRFCVEFLRTDTRGSIWFLSTSQFISVLFAIPIGIFILLKTAKIYGNNSPQRAQSDR